MDKAGEQSNRLLAELFDAIVEMEEDVAAAAARAALAAGLDVTQIIDTTCLAAMEQVGALFEQEEYFIPELLSAADAFYAALDVLRPGLDAAVRPTKQRPRLVIGSIEGDTHDIGKNVVSLILDTSGCEVLDLGRDVPAADYVAAAVEHQAQIIAVSTLMTTTMERLGWVIRELEQRGLRQDYLVIVGGRPVSAAFAQKLGADGYAANAAGALRLVRQLVDSATQAIPGQSGLHTA